MLISLRSRLDWLARQDPAARRRILESLSPADIRALVDLAHQWEAPLGPARPEQVTPPGDWFVWLLLAGRGFGKTRTGAEFVRRRVDRGEAQNIVIAAPTAADVRDVCVLGESGLLAIYPPHARPVYEKSNRAIKWKNGATAILVSADEPERFRGLQADTVWCDELASWRYPDAWTQLMLGTRLGAPKVCVTTTPKPVALVRELIARADCLVTRGSTYDNRANLSEAFFSSVVATYEGTRTGRQELHAEILEDVDGAIVSHAMIDDARVCEEPALQRTVVAIDPAVTSGENADETGIIVAGKGIDADAYVVADLSCRLSPDGWARRAVEAFHRYRADRIVVERNNGGEMCEATLRQVDRSVPVKSVVASRGKHVRFEPVGALYEQGRVHHVGSLAALEDQLCSFTASGYGGAGSPDRADAAVWAISELMLRRGIGWEDIHYAA